jgi:hypothetical protein
MNVRLFKNHEEYTVWYNANCDKCKLKNCKLQLEVLIASVLEERDINIAYKIGCKHIKGSSSVKLNKICNKFKQKRKPNNV